MKLFLLPLLLLASCTCSPEGPAPAQPQDPGAQGARAEPLPEGVLLQLDPAQSPPGELPAGWIVAETKGAGNLARWSCRQGPGGREALHVATTNAGSTFNLLLSGEELPAEIELSVRVHADSGEEDQGGGLVWRALGPDDYYVARWNPLEDNLRVYKVERGVRSLLQSAEVRAPAEKWHTLGVTMVSEHITVSLDGEPLLDTHDETFAGDGRVGLWTKADACTWFSDLIAREPRWPDER